MNLKLKAALIVAGLMAVGAGVFAGLILMNSIFGTTVLLQFLSILCIAVIIKFCYDLVLMRLESDNRWDENSAE